MKIFDTMLDINDDFFYDARLRIVLESHLDMFRKDSELHYVHTVDPFQRSRYINDFFGYMDVMNVEKHKQWFIMRLNGYTCPRQFDENVSHLLFPTHNEIEIIKTVLYNGID